MTVLSTLVAGLASGSVEVVDLTAPLSADTPLLQLPEQFGQTARFELELISRYDDAGPAWYWNNFRTGEHTGTHFDAPVHWVTGQDGDDVASVPPGDLVGPAAVLDFSAEAGADPDFLVEIDHIKAWEKRARPAARARLAAGAHRLGRAGPLAGGVPQRRRERPAHARAVGRVRAVGGPGVAGHRHGRRDGRQRRRGRGDLRPRCSPATRSCTARASTA